MAYTTIDNPAEYFNTKLYTSTNSELAISGIGFAPDWVWIKSRSHAHDHHIYDTVRGATKLLNSLNSDAEATNAQGLKSFDSDGFTLGTDGNINESGNETYASWNWKKVAGVFDIVTYAGNNTGSRQVSHNLGVVPSLIIIKNRTNASSWWIGSTEISFTWNTDYLQLNETAAKGTDGGGHIFGAVPTSSYFVPGDNNDTNGNSNNYVAYLFGNKQGVSKVGSYTASSDSSSFIFTGFKPAWLMVKQIESGGNINWGIFDNKRPGFNSKNGFLYANTNAAEDTSNATSIDLLSNGFQLRANTVGSNPGKDYIYLAFAEQPFVTSTGVPATAR